jgi:hypothetical protein
MENSYEDVGSYEDEDELGDDDDEVLDRSNEITKPGAHDVLLGRGGGTNNHFGNVNFRKLVNEHKMRYLACSKVEKPKVAREVVQIWRAMTPPGRFLSRKDDTRKGPGSVKDNNNIWLEVGDKKAREKASQCLRERTPDVLPYIKQLRQQQDQLTEQGVSRVQHQLQMQQQQVTQISGFGGGGMSSMDPELHSPPEGVKSIASAFAARRQNVVLGMPDRPTSHLLPHGASRRGSMPVAPTSVGSSDIPYIHSSSVTRRTSLPPAGNLGNGSFNTNAMQLQHQNNMMAMQQQQMQQRHHALQMAERHAGFLSPRNNSCMTERSLMMQQQFGVADIPHLSPLNEQQHTSNQLFHQQHHHQQGQVVSPQRQAQMLSPQQQHHSQQLQQQHQQQLQQHQQNHLMSPQPNQVTSFPGRLTASAGANSTNTNNQHLSNMQLQLRILQLQQQQQQQQLHGMQVGHGNMLMGKGPMIPGALPLSDDLEPLPYGSEGGVSGNQPVPDVPTSRNMVHHQREVQQQPHHQLQQQGMHHNPAPQHQAAARQPQHQDVSQQHVQNTQSSSRQAQASAGAAQGPPPQQQVEGQEQQQQTKQHRLNQDGAPQRGFLKQEDFQPLPLNSKTPAGRQTTQQSEEKPAKKSSTTPTNNGIRHIPADTATNPKAPIPGHVDDGELTLREYRKTLEDFISNHHMSNPSNGGAIGNDEYDDPDPEDDDDLESEFVLEGLDTSAWIQQALNNNNDDSGSDLMESAGSAKDRPSRKNFTSSAKSMMSSTTSYMSIGMTSDEMEHTADHDGTKTLDTAFSREAKMSMSRSMHSNQSLMSELTDFSGTEIL